MTEARPRLTGRGLAVIAMGTLLLLDQEDVLSLSLAIVGAIVSAAVGTILIVSGLGEEDREGDKPLTPAERQTRLARDRQRAVLAGVYAGVARRLNVDPLGGPAALRGRGARLRRRAVAAMCSRGSSSTRARRAGAERREPGRGGPAAGPGAQLEGRGRGRFPHPRPAAGPARGGDLVVRCARLAPDPRRRRGGAAWRQSQAIDARRNRHPSRPAAGQGRGHALDPPFGDAGLYRGGFGVALVLGAALLFLYANGALGDARDVVLAVVVAGLALGLILAPFLLRLGRNLATERAERIRSQERAELAAHLHDSVLQTLTLMQKRASDPREVAALAGVRSASCAPGCRAPVAKRRRPLRALDAAAAEVEDAQGRDRRGRGRRPVGRPATALVAATREALVNAAKFAGDAGPVAVYAEMAPERAQVFMRDRGDGFDPERVPADRRGLGESIIGRMRRQGHRDGSFDAGIRHRGRARRRGGA